jgi:hypothetical protein
VSKIQGKLRVNGASVIEMKRIGCTNSAEKSWMQTLFILSVVKKI